MDRIENSPFPLVFKQDDASPVGLRAGRFGRRLQLRTATRALAGMQKEALVNYGPTGTSWRLVCDEGPWLDGTDLAPFPLGFFTAGLVASYMSEFMTHAGRRDVEVQELEVMVDNLYGMEGSLLRGTMVGSAQPVEVTFRARASTDVREVLQLAHLAVASSPADALLRNAVDSVFTLNHNGRALPVTRVAASAAPQHEDPIGLFAAARPAAAADFAADILQRMDGVDTLGGEKLGGERSSAVGLSDTQKRQVHVRGVGTLQGDGMKALQVACLQPVGSVFHFLSDDSAAVGGQERAPSGLVYLSAGISFCFMTQLGRYAHVAKHEMQSYQVVQDTSFSVPAAINDGDEMPTSAAVDTHVFIGNQEGEDKTQTLLNMGEQTCYLHAACRSGIKTRIRLHNQYRR
jgi:organic hydroperoxide reductase OsmC/OhrA